jgi:hypothetical protein
MTRLTLNPGLPKRTNALRTLEDQMAGLNDMYWLIRAANQDFVSRGSADEKLLSYVKAPVLSHLDITRSELISAVPDIELRMRHMMLVSAVSYHEDYIATALEAFLILNPSNTTTSSIKIKLSDVPATGFTKDEIRNKVISSMIDDIISSRYKERFDRIAKLIRNVSGNDIRNNWTDDSLGAAPFEARNCVIHSAGHADARAVVELSWFFPGLNEGALLPLDEASLWRLLGALRDMARIIDLGIRKKT